MLFWHCECVCGLSEKTFITRYQKWCRKHGYNFNENKALDIYASACGHFGVMPKTDPTKLLVGNRLFPNSGQDFCRVSCSQSKRCSPWQLLCRSILW